MKVLRSMAIFAGQENSASQENDSFNKQTNAKLRLLLK